MSDIAQRTKLLRLLSANPEVRQVVARALEVEEHGRASNQYYLGWEWHDIPVAAQKLRILVEEEVIKVSYNSRAGKMYVLRDPELVQQALATIGDMEATEGEEPGQVPPDLFGHIVGHDEVKYWLFKSLASPQPVHIIMVGPPATAKSLFLEALGTLPGAQYALGGSSSRAGIADFLLHFRPRYLVIDELDKMKAEDYSVLLALMQSGIVARMKKNLRDVERMTVSVFAGVNRKERLPPELVSRFVVFDFVPYTRVQFIEVAVAVITGQLGKDAALARYIAEKVALRTLDVRNAIHVAQLCETQEEVDRFERGAAPGRMF